MTTVKIIRSFILCCVFSITQVLSHECVSPLGMEDGRIKDSQITNSSVLKGRPSYVWQARLNQSIPPWDWDAWCPDTCGSASGRKINERNYDQYIQIDLLTLTKITEIATQGREYLQGREYVRDYKISYRRDGGVWNFYQEKDQTVKIFKGNTSVFIPLLHKLDPAITVRYIRVHPGYDAGNCVCMTLELYGCVPKGILSYSMPVGQTIENGKLIFNDTSYNGVIISGVYKDGTGILTDDKFGPDDAKQDKGKGWVGWSSSLTESSYIDITFEFSGVRKFKDVTLTVNVAKKRSYAVFKKLEIFFALKENDFSNTSFLQYCPGKSVDSNDTYSRNITLSLCKNAARFIKLRLYFGGRWLLLTEISFNSVPVNGNEKTSLQEGVKDCHSSDSNNLQITIIIVCVILFIVILLFVGIFLLYRRRVFCFGKMKRSKTNKDQDVQDHGIPINDETAPYEEVGSNSPHSVYPELDRNRRVENTSDSTYQKPLKPCSENVIPAGADGSHELVPDSSPSVCTKPNRKQMNENTNELKPDSGYMIPAEDHTYEEVGEKSLPGYTELDQTKRENDDASYQELLKN